MYVEQFSIDLYHQFCRSHQLSMCVLYSESMVWHINNGIHVTKMVMRLANASNGKYRILNEYCGTFSLLIAIAAGEFSRKKNKNVEIYIFDDELQ